MASGGPVHQEVLQCSLLGQGTGGPSLVGRNAAGVGVAGEGDARMPRGRCGEPKQA
jgi:hypothetical protein